MNLNPIIVLIPIFLSTTTAVRLNKLFQFIDGFKSEHQLRGFLHVGYDYAVFLRKPEAHDKYLTYELYETNKFPDMSESKPRILAISKVPIEFIKEQMKIYREELYKAKYIDENAVPGTLVRTLREWQIDRALSHDQGGLIIQEKPSVLRSLVL